MRYSRWEDAMVTQADLLSRVMSPATTHYLAGMQDSMNFQYPPEQRKPDGFFQALQKYTLENADPVYMSGDICEVIDYARKSFVPEAVRPNDPFTPSGFVLLPRPIMVMDSAAGVAEFVPVRAVSWCAIVSEDDPDLGCFWISFYSDSVDDVEAGRMPADAARSLDLAFGRMGLVHMFQWTFHDAPWEGDLDLVERRCGECGGLSSNLHMPECSRDGIVQENETTLINDGTIEARAREQVALIQTIWRIGQQTFKTKERAPRGIWKDARRRGMEQQDVTVVRLRRSRDPHEIEPAGRQLTVQFIVRGHWRKQPCKDGVRQIWIAPYVKGPENAPFKATKRVFEFVR